MYSCLGRSIARRGEKTTALLSGQSLSVCESIMPEARQHVHWEVVSVYCRPVPANGII